MSELRSERVRAHATGGPSAGFRLITVSVSTGLIASAVISPGNGRETLPRDAAAELALVARLVDASGLRQHVDSPTAEPVYVRPDAS